MVAANKKDREWYAREKERVRRWRSKRSLAGRDIGRLPPVVDPKLKRACKYNLKLFAQTYFPTTFNKPFSDDHDLVIGEMERAILNGGLFALAMPRGSGKTALAIVAALWAVLYGHHVFVLLVAATASKAKEMLVTIKTELRTNDRLAADFPEAVFPIRALEGITNRAAGQRYNGQPTFISWTNDQVVLPTIPDSPAAGAIVRVAGINAGNIRGQHFKRPGGGVVRPSLCIPDDPQTDRSAKSPAQCEEREKIIKQAILESAGPGETMTIICAVTVIRTGDVSDRLLDPNQSPGWTSLRTKTLYAFPTNMKRWEEYHEVRLEGLRVQKDSGAAGTAFYKKHRAEMDTGAKVAWKHRFDKAELSAIQHAMTKFLNNRPGFAAEYQNEPLRPTAAVEIRILTAAQIAEKLNRSPRGELPQFVALLNAGVDVQQDVLWWMVCGWNQAFDGAIVDYGTWPPQKRTYFTLTDLDRTITDELGAEFPSLDERLYEALERLTDELLRREFRRADGTMLRITRQVVDAGYETKTVKKFCRQSRHAALLLPSHGRGIGAKQTPISQWGQKEGERRGEEWVIGRTAEVRGLRHLTFDSNHWKTQVQKRLATSMGGRGGLSLPGDRAAEHRMLSDHLASEQPTMVKAKGRDVIEWEQPAHRPDNHLLDNLVQCAVAASIDGSEVLAHKTPPARPRPSRTRKRVSYL